MIWTRMLAYITGTVDQELLLRNEYLTVESRILRAKIKGRLLLSDSWHRELIARKFDGSRFRKSVGRPSHG
jgi:hypothetical protein